MDWDGFDPTALFATIREHGPAADAEHTVHAFEEALDLVRAQPELLEHLLVASVCLVALREDETPRTILDRLFRRSVSDDEWRDRYAELAG